MLIASLSLAESPDGIQTYFKNMRISAERHQRLANDIKRYHNADNLWDIMREDFSLPHYESIPAVQEKINWYMNNQDYLLRITSRAAPFLYYIYKEVKKRHLPAELVLLPFVESAYIPFSISNRGAAGIWQLMPETATGFGIKRDFWYDGRRDIIASTNAALNYLAYLQTFFDGNWLLAIAAYNTGEGNVLAAIKRNIREGKSTDFWSLPVAQQTRAYVPSVLALATIISHPEQYPIYFPPVRNASYLARVDVGTQINLKLAAGLAGMSYERLMQLNPGFNRIATSKYGPHSLLLPIENVEQFAENLQHSPLSKHLLWVNYKIKNGDSLFSLAKRFNTSVNVLRKVNQLATNRLKPDMEILIPNTIDNRPESALTLLAKSKAGRNILLNMNYQKIFAKHNLTKKRKYTLQPGDTIYIIRKNDTLNGIARRFKINKENLIIANQLSSQRIIPGKRIIIPTHPIMTATRPVRNILQTGDTIYMVRRGDTVEKIARKFKTTAEQIRLANLMSNNSLQVGDHLTIPTHLSS